MRSFCFGLVDTSARSTRSNEGKLHGESLSEASIPITMETPFTLHVAAASLTFLWILRHEACSLGLAGRAAARGTNVPCWKGAATSGGRWRRRLFGTDRPGDAWAARFESFSHTTHVKHHPEERTGSACARDGWYIAPPHIHPRSCGPNL